MISRNGVVSMATVVAMLTAVAVSAQSHYPGQHAGMFALQDKLAPKVQAFNLDEVRLLDSRFKQNTKREIDWLMNIDTKRLLHSFKIFAGMADGVEGGYFEIKKLAGWESLDCELRGHTTGHILSALALLYAGTGEQRFKQKADTMINVLAEVQQALNQDGYLSAFPQELINRNLEGKSVWAPWYTLHKIMAGLIDQYLYCNNDKALDIVKHMSAWAYKKLSPVGAEQRTRMLRNEFGGVNECFYNLYAITGNPHDKWLGEFFYHNDRLDPLKEEKDVLNPHHANTYIPKLLGLTRAYEIEGSGDGHQVANFFWNTVVSHHSFVTGSNSHKEHFFAPDSISTHLTGLTGETCNTYNMLKLTRHLYTHTGDVKYADYYEKALVNHILGQQDTTTGMVAYFLPMLSGAYKVYSQPDSSFWCCVGSGFENHAKYNEAIYYHSDNSIYVNLFIASELNWKEKNFTLRQETGFPYSDKTILTITQAAAGAPSLQIRYPSWATNGAVVKINGKAVKMKQVPGSYITLDHAWKTGDKVEITFPMSLRLVPANDNPRVAAVAYGPVVLAARLGKNFTGRAPFSDPTVKNDYYTYNYKVPAGITSDLNIGSTKLSDVLEPVTEAPLTFRIKNTGILMAPLFDIHQERYNVYWNIR